MTQAIGPIAMVSFFNGFIDFICFKSLHPAVSNSFEQNKHYSTFILSGGFLILHVWFGWDPCICIKIGKAFWSRKCLYFIFPDSRSKLTLWTWSLMELFWLCAGRQAQAACKAHVRDESHAKKWSTSLHLISKERAATGVVTLGFWSAVMSKRSHFHLLYSPQ